MMKRRGGLSQLISLVITLCTFCEAGYKPVIIIHGLLDDPSAFTGLTQFIQEAHPGTNVSVIDLFDDLESLLPLWQQVGNFTEAIRPIMKSAPGGVHMIGFSQGGILARGIISTMSDHNVQNFLSLSSPQMGQYGDTSYLEWLFPHKLKEELYKVCYEDYGQDISVCQYWNDPHHHDLYLKKNNYLPILNNETYNDKSQEYKKNFLKLKNLVLIGGPDDGVITPWQSSQYGFYNSSEAVIAMKQQKVYAMDSFGLRTLDKRGCIKTYTIPGVEHVKWHTNETVFKNAILPWLS
ncbi:lysosomal thioesterase PPT2-A-like [Ptychodera flava]|uniref:lysosomal thioesterase PPT2-A-like n=1 Tax=Ptychodera flava TaxID=63121 RepID=UPI00396A3546